MAERSQVFLWSSGSLLLHPSAARGMILPLPRHYLVSVTQYLREQSQNTVSVNILAEIVETIHFSLKTLSHMSISAVLQVCLRAWRTVLARPSSHPFGVRCLSDPGMNWIAFSLTVNGEQPFTLRLCV